MGNLLGHTTPEGTHCTHHPVLKLNHNSTAQTTVAGVPKAEVVQVHLGDGETFFTILTGSSFSKARDRTPQQVLCNKDHLSDYSESSLSITSPIISDDDNSLEPDLNESETESDKDWEDEPEGNPNRGQNLQFQLQAAAAGVKHLSYSSE
ncbi:hypothetical protein BDM02DRAFT_3189817 [Thelephora ganbajun]|uniref:Uncharacterized protein n=1 Tax=Thelephora ganbajun TaxID=370292 RepID=A0ACB6Z6G8_THEGA|nr:hypothetical protein BDM02DRAFT_3189817 [Thelephora ganbajun]